MQLQLETLRNNGPRSDQARNIARIEYEELVREKELQDRDLERTNETTPEVELGGNISEFVTYPDDPLKENEAKGKERASEYLDNDQKGASSEAQGHSIRAPPIHAEIITHHKHLDHGKSNSTC